MTTAKTDIPWSVHPIQEEFCKSTARYRTLVAGRRFGKNHAAIVSEADFALNPEDYPFGRDNSDRVVLWWVGPTYNQTRKYGFEKAKEAIPAQFVVDEKETTPFEIHLENGVTWEFYSFDRPKSLDGAGVDSMVIDERGYMDTEIWETNLAAMLLDTNGRVAFIGKPWPNEHFEECFNKGLDPDNVSYESWHATSYDNPLIPDDRIDEIFGDLPDPIYRREILAEFGASGGIFREDMLSFVHPDSISEDWRLKTIIAVDPAATVDAQKALATDSDYWAASVIQAHTRTNTIYVTDIARKRGMTLQQGCQWIGQIANSARGATVVCEANQAQRWLVDELHDHGVHAEPVQSTRGKEDRLLDLSIPLENDTIQFVDWNADSENDVGDRHPYGDLVDELLSFPEGNHDDLIDSLHRAVDYAPVSTGANILGADPYENDE